MPIRIEGWPVFLRPCFPGEWSEAEVSNAMEFQPSHDVPIHATAWLLGERIDTRSAPRDRIVSRSPLTLDEGPDRLVVLYRFGAAVVFTSGESPASSDLARLRDLVSDPFEAPESDEAWIRVAAGEPEGPDRDGLLVIRETSLERLQVVADVLARSAFLAHYEAEVASAMDRVQPLAQRVRSGGSARLRGRTLLEEIGFVLDSEIRMIGRAEVSEKPGRLWEHPDLDALYVRFADEYELVDRDRAVTRKLDLLGRAASTFLEMLNNRHILRVEWYIVILILIEIVLLVYELAVL
jgi:uncharacterized Rmd1/YagE family protein